MAKTIDDDSNHFDVESRKEYRHWCADEKYAGGDALLTAIDQGWVIGGVIFRQDFWHAGIRRVPVYHFELHRGAETAKMVVVDNPFVQRVVNECGVQLVQFNQRKQVGEEIW